MFASQASLVKRPPLVYHIKGYETPKIQFNLRLVLVNCSEDKGDYHEIGNTGYYDSYT